MAVVKSISRSTPGKPPQKRGRRLGQQKERKDDDAYYRNTWQVAGSTARSARRREGPDSPQRRDRAAPPALALGPGRQDLHVRHRGRQQDAEGSVRWALAASRLSLYVRARLQDGVRVLLGDRRRFQRHLCPFGKSRR